MAYAEELAERIRDVVFEREGVTEKKMFGGLAWMSHGNMAVATFGEGLLVRVARDEYEGFLAEPHVGRMEMGERVMRGFVVVDSPGIEEDSDLTEWIETGVAYASSLPAK